VGILDQAASCLGRAGQAILLDCRSLEYEYLPARLPGVALVICDTGVRRELAHSAYNERRQQCEQATALLAGRLASEGRTEPVTALRDVSLDELTRHADALPAPLLQRARHVVSENARVQQAALALRAGDTHALGALLFASHASLRDDYAVSCLELDTMVELARQVPGILGARLLGAGFGGCALVLCAQAGVGLLCAVLARNYPARTGRAARVFVGGIGGGPGAVRLR
jgi:galactokinase